MAGRYPDPDRLSHGRWTRQSRPVAWPESRAGRLANAPSLPYAEGKLVRIRREDYRRYSAALWIYCEEIIHRLMGDLSPAPSLDECGREASTLPRRFAGWYMVNELKCSPRTLRSRLAIRMAGTSSDVSTAIATRACS